MTKTCITHHFACECREAQFAKLRAENERFKAEVQDYKTRCQVWADSSLARDKYVHEMENGRHPYSRRWEAMQRVVDAARFPGCYCDGLHEGCSFARVLADLDALGKGE